MTTTAPALTFHVLTISHPCLTVLKAAELKGLEHEVVALTPGRHNEAMREVFGEGRTTVPGLLLDGERVHGSRAILEQILELPYTLSGGTYVWPFAYDKQEDQLTDYERELLGEHPLVLDGDLVIHRPAIVPRVDVDEGGRLALPDQGARVEYRFHVRVGETVERRVQLGDIGFLGAAARASVDCELAEEDAYAIDGPAQAPALLELRDAMSLVWRILLLWLAVLSIFVLAGFVN